MIRLEVWGEYALFTRPEMKVERVTYDVMTPSAARGIVDAIFWHPGLKWHIRRIYVCSPIEFVNLRRNEVKGTISCNNVRSVMNKGEGPLYQVTSDDIVQRASLLLKNVHYVIEADFAMTEEASPSDNPAKFQEMITRRMAKGQYYHQPYFGCREFPAMFSPCEEIPECPPSLRGSRDLGYMLYDMNYDDLENIQPMFFRAVMQDGIIDVPARDSKEVVR